MTTTQRERLAGVAEVSDHLGVTVATLYDWRYKRIGPKAIKVGRYLRYRWSDVDAWLESQAGDREAS
jgi:predicted DNA-binding transcriptional regulator AlpA